MDSIFQHFRRLLGNDKATAADVQAARERLLNMEPAQEWVKDHPILKTKRGIPNGPDFPMKYIPIEVQREIITALWPEWEREIVKQGMEGNAYVCHVRLHLPQPGGKIRRMDGTGAAALQMDKGAAAFDFSQIKSAAFEQGVGKAATAAEKNAADCLGRLFGSHLNKADFETSPMEAVVEGNDLAAEAKFAASMKAAKTAADVKTAFGELPAHLRGKHQAAATARGLELKDAATKIAEVSAAWAEIKADVGYESPNPFAQLAPAAVVPPFAVPPAQPAAPAPPVNTAADDDDVPF